MTYSDIHVRIDPTPYSTRRCRCGGEMQRLVAPGRYAWTCPRCGRQHRQ